jgi:NADPH:quinone reductase-like Zn-dependent oxidoreductase
VREVGGDIEEGLVGDALAQQRPAPIGTASPPETQTWVKELGAHHVIDHSKPIAEELKRIGFPAVDIVVSLTQTDAHFDQIVEAIAPQGRFGLIDNPVSLDVTKFKRKSVSVHWELMFTRALFGTADWPSVSAPSTRPTSNAPTR